MKFKLSLLAVLALVVSCGPAFTPADLRCEGMDEPLGIDSAVPHFSWKVRSDKPAGQTAYEIQVASSESALKSGKADLWATGKVESADQVMVPYDGKPLASRQMCWWRVRVWKSAKEVSKWSAPKRFGVGIVGEDSLKGEYIGAVPGQGRSPILRKAFKVEGSVKEAYLYVNSLGYHEAYLNGRKVSEAVLTPAVSQLDKRSLIVVYDVSGMVKNGENEIVLWTSSGWYKPLTFDAVYDGPLVKAELDAVTPDGMSALVCTDSSWEGAWSGYRDYDTWGAWHFGGEVADARIVPASMDRESLDKLGWKPVDVVKIEGIEAAMQMCEPCLVQEILSPKSVEPYGKNAWLVDFGRVVNGMLEMRFPERPAGDKLDISYCDDKDDGQFKPVDKDYLLSSGSPEGDVFASKFNHHVFRYVIIENLEAAPQLKDIKARRMRTGYARAATFESSDEDLNKIHDMVAYTLENLAFDGYMVDCASIERLGYGGDGNASALTFQIMYDASPLYVNWLQAWNDAIHEDGSLPHTAPCPYRAGGGPYWCGFIVQAPWRTYMSYGDARLLERCYPTMKHWLDYVDAYTVEGLLKQWPNTDYRHWYLGDWAAPDGVDVEDPRSVDLVNNCSLIQVYADLEKNASIVGHPEEAEGFKARREALAKRINEVLYDPETCIYGSGSQIDMVYPMLVGIVPESELPKVKDKLFERTATEYDGHLKTGLVGIPVVTEWATLAGECDWMYGMLKKRDYPGYLYMIDNGATGTWEHWNARRSRLHNCFNGIGSWFYQALGGIIPDAPGYRHIILDPQVPEGLETVNVTKETPYGTIVVRRNGNKLHFELPAGVSATVKGSEYSCGKYDIEI